MKEEQKKGGSSFEGTPTNTNNQPNNNIKISNKQKKRHWAFVIYPDSLPDNYIDILTQTGLEIAISPLHDLDIDPNGEVKKAHYHVIACYTGPTTFNVVNSLCQSLNAPIPQFLESVKGYYRYLTHKDNPEKAQYNESDIVALNGFDYRAFVEMTKSETLLIKKEIHQFIIDNDIYEYFDLMNLLLESSIDWYDVACSNTLYFNNLICSKRHKMKDSILNR